MSQKVLWHLLVLALVRAGVFSASDLSAQTQAELSVAGVVVDTSGAPLAGARVGIPALRREAFSRGDGTFILTLVPRGAHELIVQRIGFRPVTQRVQVDASVTSLRIAMTPTVITLMTTVVTGTISARSASEVLSPTTIVSEEALARKLRGSVAATLQREPGMSVAGMGPATARPVVRGLSGDRVVLLEDGVRPGDLSSTSPDHAVAVDPLNASRFEIVRGPMSLLYGSSALGGVVNVIREEIPTSLSDHLHGALNAEFASVNSSVAAGAFAVTSAGSFALRGEANVRSTGDVRGPQAKLANTEQMSFGGSIGASHVTSHGYAGGSYRYYSNDYGIPGGFVGGHVDGVDITMHRHSAKFEAERRPEAGPFESLKASAAYTRYHHAELQLDGDVATAFDQQYAAVDLVTRHAAAGVFSHGVFGIRGQWREIITAGALNTPSTRDYSVAGFAIEEWERGALHLQAGLRYDIARYEPLEEASVTVGGEEIPALPRDFGSVSGSLGALVHATEEIQFGASASRAYRTPDFNELYSDGPHLAAFSYDVGNPRLRQETGFGIDVFARMSRPGLQAEVAWFRNRMSNFVFPVNTGALGPQGGRPKFQFVGKDAVLTGAEASAEWNPLLGIVLEGNLSFVRGALAEMPDSIPEIGAEPARAGARFLPLMPPLNGNVGIRYESDSYFVGVESHFADRQERLGDFETTSAGYALISASAGIRIYAGERMHSITLRAENLANREYRDHLSRIKDIMPGSARNISLLYRVTF